MNEKKVSRRDFLKKYGIGGLSALILLAIPNEVKAGVSDNLSSAEGTSFDDTAAQLGASNVQKAIEKVKGSVDDLSVNKANVSQLSDGSVTKVGTGTVGGANTPIYLDAGVPKACNEFAPKSHASTGTGYGVGNGSNYGHVKLSDAYSSAQANMAAANGVAASQNALGNAYHALNTAKANVSQLSDGSVTKVGTGTVGGANTPIYLNAGVPKACNEFAPKSHASTGTGYGVGNGSNYGHVKLSDTYATEQSNVAAANAVGASAYALQQAYKTLNNKIDNYTLHKLSGSFRRDEYKILILYLLDTNVNSEYFSLTIPCVASISASYSETNVENNVVTVTMNINISADGNINFENIKTWGYLHTGGSIMIGTAPLVHSVYGLK